MKKRVSLFVTLCFVSILTIGCGKGYEEKIVGTWKMDYWAVYASTGTYGNAVDDWFFTFNKGGKGFMMSPITNPYDNTTESTTTEFEYSVSDEELYMSQPDFELNHIEKLDDNKMILSQTTVTAGGEQMTVLSFTKKRTI